MNQTPDSSIAQTLQDWGCEQPPGELVPVLDHPPSEELFPSIQSGELAQRSFLNGLFDGERCSRESIVSIEENPEYEI